jgi:hypothetical protein
MPRFKPHKLHVTYMPGITEFVPITLRCYTLTHSDSTGDLFLSIGHCYDTEKTSKRYTRFMRDEVLAQLKNENSELSLNLHYHVSGGFVFGNAGLRYRILRRYVSYNIKAIMYGDRSFLDSNLEFDQVPILVFFHSKNKKYEKTEKWGLVGEYKM